MTSKALILVDFENEWTDKSSDYFVGDISDLIKKTNKLLDYCRKNGYKIIFTTHIEKDSNSAFVQDSKNVEIIKELHKQNSDVLITKNKISPFYKTNLEKELKEINEIVICGILTNLCVRSLAQDAYDRDFKITIIKDCCRAFDEETHEFTLKDLKATREEIEFLNLNKFIR
ncbi:cysteine hydrolase [Candidatus Pacearchaeota archaeon]|nr:cysteine hydrolase [Candidatus Pacearchaeota archaeon]